MDRAICLWKAASYAAVWWSAISPEHGLLSLLGAERAQDHRSNLITMRDVIYTGQCLAVGLHPVLVGGKHCVCADAGASVDKYYLGREVFRKLCRAGQGVLDMQSMLGAWAIIL